MLVSSSATDNKPLPTNSILTYMFYTVLSCTQIATPAAHQAPLPPGAILAEPPRVISRRDSFVIEGEDGGAASIVQGQTDQLMTPVAAWSDDGDDEYHPRVRLPRHSDKDRRLVFKCFIAVYGKLFPVSRDGVCSMVNHRGKDMESVARRGCHTGL